MKNKNNAGVVGALTCVRAQKHREIITAINVTQHNLPQVCEYIKQTTGATAKVVTKHTGECIVVQFNPNTPSTHRNELRVNIGEWVVSGDKWWQSVTHEYFKENYERVPYDQSTVFRNKKRIHKNCRQNITNGNSATQM